MVSDLLYDIWPYQMFKSVLFRGGMAFLTTYWIIVALMPSMIYRFRRKGITADFMPAPQEARPYTGAKPIMGGILLLFAITASTLFWVQVNQFVLALLIIMISFGAIGAWDDVVKIKNRRQVEKGLAEKKSYTDKADGISGTTRLLMEILVALVVVMGLYRLVDIDGHMVVPFTPTGWWYPYLPKLLFVPFMVLIIVAGANAVNLTDGMDSLATVPILTTTLFVAAVAYVGGEPEFAARLRLPVLPPALKEMVPFAAAILAAGLAFLRFNSPPAMIIMGDLGALALGSTISAMFIFMKVELFLPLVGGVFVLTTLSTIIQRLFFKGMLKWKGREVAEKVRFFYRAPYHHHLQALWTFKEGGNPITSVWVEIQKKIGIKPPSYHDQLIRREDADHRVIWRLHMLSIWLLVLTLVIYFKVR
ncbi:MAG: phospho-N-acetylmuramoyl-pentapeptide-transferase [Deltaproteobacteria bacterium]|nr:phospho-N-acetylmuramoyl-pentapeptide-transferase [Deltaproteobacteria bacterium]